MNNKNMSVALEILIIEVYINLLAMAYLVSFRKLSDEKYKTLNKYFYSKFVKI